MPYGKIAERKGHQGWMKQEGSYFIFPGGGTMFPDGAEQYIAKLGQFIPIKSGLIRTALDMGCGVIIFYFTQCHINITQYLVFAKYLCIHFILFI
jgi:putative homogalacturonan methyltransferase